VTIGVLALQGDFEAHRKAFSTLGAETREVRHTSQLAGLDGLVLPGGESTTLLNLMRDEPWFAAIDSFHKGGGAVYGTCAGAILLAREVRSPAQPSLGLLDAVVERNSYGRQIDSFEADLDWSAAWDGARTAYPAVFIRAPRFIETGPDIEILARNQGEPVLVQSGRVLAATFHPELTDDLRIPRLFVERRYDARLA
jgi:5'-phosphate synthase pdxT subunit